MADEPAPRGLFGWENPGRNIAYIVIGSLFGGLTLAAWLSGAL